MPVVTIWVVPAAVLVAGIIPVLVVARRVAEELVRLRDEFDRTRELRPALVELRDETAALRAAALERARRHRL